MLGQYVQIKHKKYAAGLVWQPMVSGVAARVYAHRLARSINHKLNLYMSYNSMIGLGARAYRQSSGMRSLAVEIMSAMPGYGSMLGVFAVDGRFVLIAVRNGVILQDLIFENENKAREKYVELAEIPDWGAYFAPAAWAMPRAVDADLREIVTGNSRPVLRSISRFGANFSSLVLFLLFAIVFLYFFREPINKMFAPRPMVSKINPELAAEYKRQLDEKNKELDKEFDMRPEPKPLVMPFDLLPSPSIRADLCYRAIGFLMQPITGWNQSVAECGEEYANVTFKRSFGTLDDFYSVAAEIMPGIFVQEIGEDELLVRARLPQLDTMSSQDMRDADTVARDLTSRFQAINSNPSITIVADVISNETNSAQIYLVELADESKLKPSEFMKIFDGVGGVYMTKASWNTTRKIWNYEVIIYAK